VLEVLSPEVQVLGALLIKVDRDRVLDVGEQLDDILPVGFPGEKVCLREQFLLALAEEALRRLRDLHHTRGVDHVDVDELGTARLYRGEALLELVRKLAAPLDLVVRPDRILDELEAILRASASRIQLPHRTL